MFKIGVFSKISQVSIRMLRYYDEIGLLKPVHVGRESGYRYYSAGQLPRLNRILALKALGLTLNQVARLLDESISPEEIRGMLTMRKAEIEQTLHDEMSRIRTIESRLKQIEREGDLSRYEVVLKSIPAQQMLGLRRIIPDWETGGALLEEMVRALPARVGEKTLKHLAFIIHSEFFDEENIDVEMGYLLSGMWAANITLSSKEELSVRALPAVETMATFVVAGNLEDIHLGYGALGTWAEANDYRFAGPAREVILEMRSPEIFGDSITEVQFPVEKIDSEMKLLS